MLVQPQENKIFTPFDNTPWTQADIETIECEDGVLEVDGTGKLQITNTGGTSASEGGMGSGSKSEKEKGDLNSNISGGEGTKPSTESENNWDPVKENIDEATDKRNKDE